MATKKSATGKAAKKPAKKAPGKKASHACDIDIGWKHFEYHSIPQNSHKFWQVKVDENVMIVRYGRVGTKGKEEIVSFASKDDAMSQASKKVREKVKKGYMEE